MNNFNYAVDGQKIELKRFERSQEIFKHSIDLASRAQLIDAVNKKLKAANADLGYKDDAADRILRLSKDLEKGSTALYNNCIDLIIDRQTEKRTREQIEQLFSFLDQGKIKSLISCVFEYLQFHIPGENVLKNLKRESST